MNKISRKARKMTMIKYGKRNVAIRIMETVGARPTQVAQQLTGVLAKKLSSADLERLLYVVRNPDRGQVG